MKSSTVMQNVVFLEILRRANTQATLYALDTNSESGEAVSSKTTITRLL
jgi:hypothetical protein